MGAPTLFEEWKGDVGRISSILSLYWSSHDQNDADSTKLKRGRYALLILIVFIQYVKARLTSVISLSATTKMKLLKQIESLPSTGFTAPEDVLRENLSKLMGFLQATLFHLSLIGFLKAPLDIIYGSLLYILRLNWTQHLTHMLLKNYIHLLAVQQRDMSNSEAGLKNIDQHIGNDVEKFVGNFLDIFLQINSSILEIYFDLKILYKTSHVLSYTAMASSAIGTMLIMYLGRGLEKLFEQERENENDFRYALTRVKENAESIAFYRGTDNELNHLESILKARIEATKGRKYKSDLIDNIQMIFRFATYNIPGIYYFYKAISQNYVQKVFVQSLDEAYVNGNNDNKNKSEQISNSKSNKSSRKLKVEKRIRFDHDNESIDIATVLQARESFSDVLYNLLVIGNKFRAFAKLRTTAKELHSLLVASQVLHDKKNRNTEILDEKVIIKIEYNDPSSAFWLQFDDVTIGRYNVNSFSATTFTSRFAPLLQNITFSLEKGDSLLISGSSGVGKTTLLRCIAELWTTGTGRIIKPHNDELMFIPQKPYLSLGSLRDQLFYPKTVQEMNMLDFQLLAVLKEVNLGYIAQRLNNEFDSVEKWSDVLSMGEQQRIAFARIIIHRPNYVILDEATSACDVVTEESMYQVVRKYCKGWVSVGHRSTIEKFHSQKLSLISSDEYLLQSVDNNS